MSRDSLYNMTIGPWLIPSWLIPSWRIHISYESYESRMLRYVCLYVPWLTLLYEPLCHDSLSRHHDSLYRDSIDHDLFHHDVFGFITNPTNLECCGMCVSMYRDSLYYMTHPTIRLSWTWRIQICYKHNKSWMLQFVDFQCTVTRSTIWLPIP